MKIRKEVVRNRARLAVKSYSNGDALQPARSQQRTSKYMKKALLVLATIGGLLIGNLALAPPAQADAVVALGDCDNAGETGEVQMCVWVNYDAARGVFRARAQIEDTGGSMLEDDNVAVSWLEFCSAFGCTRYNEYDDWHRVFDDIHSNLGSCAPAGRRFVWVSANFGWGWGGVELRQTLTASGYVC